MKRFIASKLSYLRGEIQSWKRAGSALDLASMREYELTEEQLRKVFGGAVDMYLKIGPIDGEQ